jgi:RHS repeat-associated protein
LVELSPSADPDGSSFPGIGRCPSVEVLVGSQEVVPGTEAGRQRQPTPNLRTRREGGVETSFRYDTRDQLVEVRTGGALTASFLYDFQGLRVAKRSGTGATVRYVYDDQSVLQTTDLAGQTLSKYDYGPDRLLSLTHPTEGRRFYLFDGLRSVTGLTDPAGSITFRAGYDAWGVERRRSGSSFNLFGFTSHELDPETNLYYARARYYDPRFGLFLTPRSPAIWPTRSTGCASM